MTLYFFVRGKMDIEACRKCSGKVVQYWETGRCWERLWWQCCCMSHIRLRTQRHPPSSPKDSRNQSGGDDGLVVTACTVFIQTQCTSPDLRWTDVQGVFLSVTQRADPHDPEEEEAGIINGWIVHFSSGFISGTAGCVSRSEWGECEVMQSSDKKMIYESKGEFKPPKGSVDCFLRRV